MTNICPSCQKELNAHDILCVDCGVYTNGKSINSDSEEDVGIVRKLGSCYEIYKDPAFPCL